MKTYRITTKDGWLNIDAEDIQQAVHKCLLENPEMSSLDIIKITEV